MGAISVLTDTNRATVPTVFVTASDGNLWENFWDGTQSRWANQGQPSPGDIRLALGALALDGLSRPYVFMNAGDYFSVWLFFRTS
jgi:hypothetical protein